MAAATDKPETKLGDKTEVESKSDKFRRLAETRATVIVRKVQQLGQLAGPGYDFTDEEVAFLFRTIREALDLAEARYRNRGRSQGVFVTLPPRS